MIIQRGTSRYWVVRTFLSVCLLFIIIIIITDDNSKEVKMQRQILNHHQNSSNVTNFDASNSVWDKRSCPSFSVHVEVMMVFERTQSDSSAYLLVCRSPLPRLRSNPIRPYIPFDVHQNTESRCSQYLTSIEWEYLSSKSKVLSRWMLMRPSERRIGNLTWQENREKDPRELDEDIDSLLIFSCILWKLLYLCRLKRMHHFDFLDVGKCCWRWVVDGGWGPEKNSSLTQAASEKTQAAKKLSEETISIEGLVNISMDRLIWDGTGNLGLKKLTIPFTHTPSRRIHVVLKPRLGSWIRNPR